MKPGTWNLEPYLDEETELSHMGFLLEKTVSTTDKETRADEISTEHWKELDVLIYTPTIVAGASLSRLLCLLYQQKLQRGDVQSNASSRSPSSR